MIISQSRQLAEFVVNSQPETLTDAVLHEAKRSFMNWLGVAIGAIRHPTVEIALATVKETAGSPAAAVLGRSDRLDILNADRKSTRLNSSHVRISYAVFCLK